jgi:hypothetical protein
MSKNEDSNYVSVGSWMWMMFVTALPVIGVIMILVWAFTGENESRKNYFRAILMWLLLLVVLAVGLLLARGLLGNWPVIQKHIHDLMRKT